MRWALLVFTVICLGLLTFGAWLVGASGGTVWLASQFSSRVPGLSIEGASGTLADEVTFDVLRYSNSAVDLVIRTGRIKLDLNALSERRLLLPAVTLGSLELVTHKAPVSPTAEVTFSMPWQLDVGTLELARVSVTVGEAVPQVFSGLEASGQMFGQDLRVGLAAARHELGTLAGEFQLQFKNGYPYKGTVEVIEVPLPIENFQSASAAFDGSTLGVAIEGKLGPAEVLADLSFEGTTSLDARIAVANASLDGFDVPQLDANAKGLLDDLGISIKGQISHSAGSAAIDVGMRLQRDVVLIEHATATGDQGSLTLTGNINLPRLELRAAFDGVLLAKRFAGDAVISGHDRGDIGGTVYVHQDKNWAVMTIAPSVGFTVNGGLTRLADIYPGLVGALAFGLVLSPQDDVFELNASGTRLAYGEWEAADVVLKSTGALAGEFSAHLSVPRLVRAAEVLGQGTLVYSGTLAAGSIKMAWQHPFAELDATLLRQGIKLSLEDGRFGFQEQDWRLAAPMAIVVEGNLVKVGDHCWVAEPARVCINDGSFGPTAGVAAVNAVGLAGAGMRLNSLAIDLSYDTVGASLEAKASGAAGIGVGAYEGDIQFTGHGSSDQVVLDRFKLSGAEMMLQGQASYAFAEARFLAEVSGTRLGRPVVASADVGVKPVACRISINIDGTRIFSLQPVEEGLNASLSIADLTLLAPWLSGSLNGDGQFDRRSGAWQLQLNSPALNIFDNRFEAVAMAANGTGQKVLDARLSTSDWQAGDYSLGAGGLTLSGDVSALELGMDWQYAGNRVDAATRFNLQENLLKGKLLRASIAGLQQNWVMDPGAEFELASNQGRLDDHCWRYSDASLCLSGVSFMDDALNLAVALVNAPVQLQDIYYAPDTRLDGRLSAAFQGQVTDLSTSPQVNANFSVQVPDGELAYFDQAMPWTMSGKGTIANNLVMSDLLIESDADNRLQLAADWPSLFAPGKFRMQSELASNSIGVITAFVPQLDRAVGTIGASLALDARDGTPTGRFSLDIGKGASVVVPLAGITLEDVTLHAEGDEKLVTLDFGATSGSGQIHGTGQIGAPLSAERELSLSVTGDNFVAVQRPELSVTASPALQFRYQGAGTAELAGHLDVTGGNLRLENLGVAPRRISPDVTVLSRKIPNQAFYQLDVGIGLTISNFAIDMYGLSGKVDGGLSLLQRPRMPRRLIGTVNLREGSFSRYGQDFAVERGRLIFAGSINNPIVDVVSSRSIDSADEAIKVSLLLSGPANNIRSQLVSVPAMSEAQALSYLVLGRSLRGASAADGQSISLAALSLGIKGVAPVTEQLKLALGLTELTLESRGVDGAMVIAGKQINPGLYVEYSYDVLGRVGGILFNYRLSDKLSLETRTGDDNSMQIIYRLE